MNKVVAEQLVGDLRVQTVTCACRPGCTSRFQLATIEGAGERWLTVGLCARVDTVDAMAAIMGQLEDADGVYQVAHGLALCGVDRARLLLPGVAATQFKLWEATPEWMLYVDVKQVEQLRSLVFGDPMTKTVEALTWTSAFGGFACREGAVDVETLSELFRRQVRLAFREKGS